MRRRFAVPFILATSPLLVAALAGCRSTKAVAGAQPSPGAPVEHTASQAAVAAPFLPPPPRQAASWTPPSGKDAEGLPLPLLSATETLFAQGLADPRGCEYRVISVQIGDVWRGDGGTVETHGWVLPGEAQGKRFAACWNGLVYPVIAVKDRANLQADIQQLVKKQAEFRTKYGQHLGIMPLGRPAGTEATSLSLESPSLLKVVYLLRLGENDLARSLYALWDAGTPPRVNGNDEIRRDPYLHLASQWAWSAYERAVCAHMRGADHLAVADTDLLTRIQPLIETEAAKRNYKTYPSGGIHQPGSPHLLFLDNLATLRKDSLRRVAQTPRPPLDVNALRKLPRKERIAELVRRLDEIDARQDGQPGGVGLDAHPIAETLIAEGDAAIEPLLDVLEKDDRLTRSVSFPRDFKQVRNLLKVKSAAFACFARITDVTQIGEGKPSVAALREWWAKNKGASPADRWFAQLADDGMATVTPSPPVPNESYEAANERQRQEFQRTHSNKKRWEEAAARIVERGGIQRRGNWVTVPRQEPGKPPPPFKGESLRNRRNPSVSDLLRKRALQMSEPVEGKWGFDYASGATFALMLYEWEPKGRDTLPTLREVMRQCLGFQSKQRKDEGNFDQYQLSGRIARLTLARLRLGDAEAATEYGAWLQTVSPQYLGSETRSALMALWREPENPAIRRLADSLFTETSAAAPTAWSRLLTDPESRGNYYAGELFASDLLRFAAFRKMVLRRLSDTTEAGTVTQSRDDTWTHHFSWNDGSGQGSTPRGNASLRRQSLRLCDRAALVLQRVAGVPRFDPLASVRERDKQCAAIAAYLNRYGTRLVRVNHLSIPPLYGHDGGSGLDYLGPAFPIRTHPATEADVREKRAVFALRGDKIRAVSELPAPLPLEAMWNNDPDANVALRSDGKTVPWSRGYIWQAEEIYDGRKWVRYYGYVGPHSLAKVPASEIQITDYRAAAQKPVASTSGTTATTGKR